MHSVIDKLDSRVVELEHEIVHFRALAASYNNTDAHTGSAALTLNDLVPTQNKIQTPVKTSAKRTIANVSSAEGLTMPGRTKYRKKLEVKIPEKLAGETSGVGLPTPILSVRLLLSVYDFLPNATQALQTAPALNAVAQLPTTPRTPYTPGRIGPPESYKKTATSLNKRTIHNLNKLVPPNDVKLPLVPLTDTEVIVYFFNSLSRPAVSLRLYARKWAPASIAQAINDHREVEPPYLRNTCSVKCTTAIKNGRTMYGDKWEDDQSVLFKDAPCCRATDLMRGEGDERVDYYVRALCTNLKQHPEGDSAGIFTACVKYCVETNAPYTMSNVHELAFKLSRGEIPEHPASPSLSQIAPVLQVLKRTEGLDTDDEEGDGEDPGTPSPLAKRKSRAVQFAKHTGFTAVNKPREVDGEHDE